MSISESDMVDAGEYALGLDAGTDRRRFETALLDDPELANAVWEWEETFRPLADALRARVAPRRVWSGIEARLFGRDVAAERRGRRAVAFWRDLSMLFATLAVLGVAGIALVIVRPDLVGIETAPREDWISAIVRLDGTIALARLDDDGRLIAEPVSPEALDRSAELWLVPETGNPVSLGLLDPETRSVLIIPPEAAGLINASTDFVVTSEPQGGSPTGQPTGERLGSGSLTRI